LEIETLGNQLKITIMIMIVFWVSFNGG
jgi:hypothetical protein